MIKNPLPKHNNKITARQVRLIDHEGQMQGVKNLDEALDYAKSLSLDLVEVSPGENPPICKIMDFGKYKYEQKKKKSLNKKKQKKINLKEMKFKVNIGKGDFDVKVRKIRQFLETGDKVKVSLLFKGREITHKEKGVELFQDIIKALGEGVKFDLEPKIEKRQIMMQIGGITKTSPEKLDKEQEQDDQVLENNDQNKEELE